MPSRTPKPETPPTGNSKHTASDPEEPAAPGLKVADAAADGAALDDGLDEDPADDGMDDHVVQRFFATHERDFKTGPRRHHLNEGGEVRPAHKGHHQRRRRPEPPYDA